MPAKHLGIRVDVCTLEGLRRGVPNLLRLFDRLKLRVTFFVAMGPDTSGRAILNVFRQKGFLKKMLRTNAVSMYGWRTMLSGTLLPARTISKKCRSTLLDIKKAGHEIGIHGWNHRQWQDKLDSLAPDDIRTAYDRSIEAFQNALGERPTCTAAPAWYTTPASLKLQDAYGFSFASDGRGDRPFFPVVGGQTLHTMQIPLTLPTLDEQLGEEGMTPEDCSRVVLSSVERQDHPVYAMHAEAEGRRYLSHADDLIQRLQAMKISIGPLGQLPWRSVAKPAEVHYGFLPGRASRVTLHR